jgi:hypothetical protein
MATVHLSSTLMRFTDGVDRLTIDAPRVHELVAALVARYPALAPQLEAMAVAIDGEVHHEAAYQRIRPDTEIYFVPKISGG